MGSAEKSADYLDMTVLTTGGRVGGVVKVKPGLLGVQWDDDDEFVYWFDAGAFMHDVSNDGLPVLRLLLTRPVKLAQAQASAKREGE